MKPPSLCSPFAALDASSTISALSSSTGDRNFPRGTLLSLFFDGSRASCEAAARHILPTLSTPTASTLSSLSDTLKSLPTAVPPRNAPPLARVCARLALSEADEKLQDACKAPLRTFCYAEEGVRRVAVDAVVAEVAAAARRGDMRAVEDRLEAFRGFFEEMVRAAHGFHAQFDAVDGLVSLAEVCDARVRQVVVAFVARMGRPVVGGRRAAGTEERLEVYLVPRLVALATEEREIVWLVTRTLLRAMSGGGTGVLHRLWGLQQGEVVRAVGKIGPQVVAAMLMVTAGVEACAGRVHACWGIVAVMRGLFVGGERLYQVHPVVKEMVVAVGMAVAAVCAAAGAGDVAEEVASVCHAFRKASEIADTRARVTLKHDLDMVCQEATFWRCGDAMLALGVLRKVLVIWENDGKLTEFIRGVFSDLLCAKMFQKEEDDAAASMFSDKEIGKAMNREDSDEMLQGEGMDHANFPEERSPLVALAGILLGILSHRSAKVRYATYQAISKISSSVSRLFFLPALVSQIQKEKSGVIVTLFLHEIMLPLCLLQQKETNKVVMKTMLQLIRPVETSPPTATYHTGLVAIAKAAKSAPGMATSVLLAEMNRLKTTFESIGPDTKCAASAAILQITTFRPTRGASFVPFIMKCTTKESMQSAPEAAAFCFDSIRVMAQEEVLDATKAVKVILKAFPNLASVANVARRSYLRLLGCVAGRSHTKKGTAIAAKSIDILKSCIVDVCSTGDNNDGKPRPDWKQVDEAASALAEYDVDQVLRIAHADAEALGNSNEERERLERIARECQEFVRNVLATAGKASGDGGGKISGLCKLLQDIAKHEWDNRQRSSFDPERIAKLRATSEALRRARRRTQAEDPGREAGNGHVEEEDRATEQFIRAVNTLPVGAIQGFCERCTLGPNKGGIEDDESEAVLRKGRAVAIETLDKAGALSPALPWVALVEEILESGCSLPAERAAALTALAHMQDESFVTSLARMKWFGEAHCISALACPQQETPSADNTLEAKSALLGMMMHNAPQLETLLANRLFQDPATRANAATIVIAALAEAPATPQTATPLTTTVLQAICMHDVPLDTHTFQKLASTILTRLDPATLRAALTALLPSPIAMHLATRTQDMPLLRACALALSPDGSAASSEALHALAAALRRLDAPARLAVAEQLAGSGAFCTDEGMLLVAECLGAAALFPDGEGCLVAAGALHGEGGIGRRVQAVVECLMREAGE